jgi:hypothetical protein
MIEVIDGPDLDNSCRPVIVPLPSQVLSGSSVFSTSINDIASCYLLSPDLDLSRQSSSINRGMEGADAKVPTWVSDEKHQDSQSVNQDLLTSTNRLSLSRRLLKGVELRGRSQIPNSRA